MSQAVSYIYKAVDDSGKVVQALMESESVDACVASIRSRGQRPISVELSMPKSKNIELKIFDSKPKSSELSMFCQQLSTMLGAGIPISRALDTLYPQLKNKRLHVACEEMATKVKQGRPLSACLKDDSDIFPPLMISMVEAGELNGKQDNALDHMAIHFVKDSRIQHKIGGAMVYPAVLLCACIAAAIFMMVCVAPMFVGMFKSSGQELPGVTVLLMAMSDSLRNYWYLYILGVAASIFGFIMYRRSDKGRKALDGLILRLPLIKEPMQQIITARFSRTFSTLLTSGVSMVDALAQATSILNNVVVQDRMEEAIAGIKQGNSLAGELTRTGLFPRTMLSMVAIGEETGAVDDLLVKTADYYDEQLDAAIGKLLSLLEPAMILLMGFIVGFMLIALMVPMLTMVAGTV